MFRWARLVVSFWQNVGAVLPLLDGPQECDPAYCVVWFGFRVVFFLPSFWGWAGVLVCLMGSRKGSPGHGPVYLQVATAAEIGCLWDPHFLGWERLGLTVLSTLAGSIQHFKSAILNAWGDKVAADLCAREGFRSVRFWTLLVPCSSLTLPIRERDKALLRSVLVGGVWNGRECEDSLCHAGSVVVLIGDGLLFFFWDVHMLLLLRSVKILNFMIL